MIDLRRVPPTLGVAVVAFVVRAAHFAAGSGDPELFGGLFLDSLYYAERAGGADEPYLLSPLYGALLAPFDVDPDGRALVVRALQLALGAGTCALVAHAAWRGAGRGAGWCAGLLLALCGPLVHHEAQVLPEGPQAFLLAAALALAVRAEARAGAAAWAPAGLALGLAAALRPTALAAAAALVALLLRRALAGDRGAARSAGWLVAGVLAAVAPFTVRNAVVAGEPVLLSASGGFNFWVGNHAGARGTFSAPPGYDFDQDPVGRGLAEAGAGRALSPTEASAWWRERALDDLARAPLAGLARIGRKLALLAHPGEIPQTGASFAEARSRSLALRAPVDARWLWLLALAGPLFGLRGRAPAGRIALVLAGGYLLGVALFFVTGRLRAPALPLLAALAGVGLDAGLAAWRDAARRRRAVRASAALAALALASLWVFRADGPLGPIGHGEAQRARQRGVELLRAGRTTEAVDALREALSTAGENDTTRTTLALALARDGRPEEAAAELRAVLARGFRPRAAFDLANLVAEPLAGTTDASRRAAWREAEALYRAALEVQPRYADARFNLGLVLMRQGRRAEARSEVETALEHAPPDSRWRADAARALELLAD